MAAQRQLYGRAACALLVCVLAAALTAAQDDEEGEVRLDPRTCYHFYNGSACARPGVFEPSAGGNATYDPLGGEGFAGVYATPLSFDRHTDALLGLLETLFLFSEEYPTDCSEHLVRMSCYSEYRFCVEDENATLVKLEQVADDMRKYAADPEYDRDGDVIAKQFDTSPVVVPQLVCPKYCESNHTVGCVDMLRYALNKDLRGLPTLPSMLASVDRWFNCSSLREETERHPLALARCIGEPRLPSPPAPPPPPFVEAEENVTDVSVAPRLMRERITAAQGLAAAAIASRAIRLQL